jgi:hypothetical protein
MRRATRLSALAVLACLTPLARANYLWNVIQSDVAFSPSGSGNIPYTISGPNDSKIDFNFGAVPVFIGDGTGRNAAIATILYEVNTNDQPAVGAIGMVINYTVFEKGRIGWTETVEDDGGNVVGVATGSFLGSSYSGGADGSFSFNGVLNFSRALNRFKVKKSFFLDTGDAGNPTTSIAAVGLVEQNLVPEPTTIAAIGFGLAALAARRRKKA